jgi:hypothetical protein
MTILRTSSMRGVHLSSIRNFGVAISAGISRFPFVIIAAGVATLCSIAANHIDSTSVDKELVRVVFAAGLALPLLVAAAFAGELFPRGRLLFHAGALAWAFSNWWFLRDLENWQIHTMLFVAALSIASAVPGLAKSPSHNWWRVNIGTLNAIVLGGLLALFVQIGLLLAIASIQSLFDLKLSKAFTDCIAICCLFIAPCAATAMLPAAHGEFDRSQPGFAVWGRLCQFAVIPLGFLFTAILTAYAAKIAFEQKLPDGMVALPVLALGCYSLAGRLLLEPWRADKAWARAFALVFPAFPLFSILLLLSLWVRIAEYGFTFERYAALALAAWLDLFCVLLLLRKNLSPAAAPALLSAFALIAIFSPFGARQVSLASQSARLEKLLAEPAPRSAESTRRLASAAEYISLNYDRSVIERFVGKLDIPADSQGYKIFAAVREKLALPELIGNGGLRSTFRWPDDKPVPLSNAKNLFPASGASSYANLGYDAEGKKLSVSHEGGQIVAKIGGNVDKTFDLGALDTLSTTAPAPPLFNWDIAGRAFTVVVVDARWATQNGSTTELEFVSFLVLEK